MRQLATVREHAKPSGPSSLRLFATKARSYRRDFLAIAALLCGLGLVYAGIGATALAATATPTPTPVVSVLPTSIAYGTQTVGTTTTNTVTVTNDQDVSITLSQSIAGDNPRQFEKTGGTCTTSLAAHSKCTYLVSFKPTKAGLFSASFNVTDSPDPRSPHGVHLTGTGTAP